MTDNELIRPAGDEPPTAEFARVAPRRGRARTVALGLAAVATAAVAVGVAVTVVNGDGDASVLSARDVSEALGTAGAPPVAAPAPSGSAVPTPAPSGSSVTSAGRVGGDDTTRADHTRQVTGGYVSFACRDGQATLRQWSPRTGYRVDDVVRGPAPTARIEFESDTHDDVTVFISCPDGAGGEPVVRESVEVDDHGGSGNGSGNDDDNSGRGSHGGGRDDD